MCLAVPAKLVEINGDRATIEIGGLRRPIRIPFIPDPKIGDYVLVHAGFALRKWSEEDVREYQAILDEMGMALEEGTEGDGKPTANDAPPAKAAPRDGT
jgi:hydrogenase expression/formation protein HypC